MKSALAFAAMFMSASAAAEDARQLVHIEVMSPPAIVATANGQRLVYELHLTNFSDLSLRLGSVAAFQNEAALAKLEDAALAAAVLPVGPDDDPLSVEPGRRVVVYVDLAPPKDARGASLSHEVALTPVTQTGSEMMVVKGGLAVVSSRKPLVLGAPLRGGPWAAVYEPGMERGHRRVFYATEGEAVLPGRFAVDFIKVDGDGRAAPGDGDDPASHFGYGAEAIAVADAVVAAVRDDVPDPGSVSGRERVSIGDASGNYVALDLGDGRYAFYEHLQRGILVSVGQRVKKGERVGRLGFTGSAGGPHLHFHVADRLSVLGAEGEPFVFERYESVGGYPSIAAFAEGGPWADPDGPKRLERTHPLPNAIIRFAD